MNFELDEIQQGIVEVVKTFAEREIAPYIKDIDAEDHLPGGEAFFKKAGEAGLLGLTFAE